MPPTGASSVRVGQSSKGPASLPRELRPHLPPAEPTGTRFANPVRNSAHWLRSPTRHYDDNVRKRKRTAKALEVRSYCATRKQPMQPETGPSSHLFAYRPPARLRMRCSPWPRANTLLVLGGL